MIVYCSTMPWNGNTGTDQQIARQLCKYAHVLYVDPSVSHLTPRNHPELAPSLEGPRLRRLDDRLSQLLPLAPPGMGRPGMRALTDVMRRRSMRRAVTDLGQQPQVVIAASFNPVFDAFPSARHVLYGTDDYVSGARLTGVAERRLVAAEARQFRRADLILAVSPELCRRWTSKGYDVRLLPNGCDVDAFSAWDGVTPPDLRLPPPIAVLIGQLNARIDVSLLETVVARGVSLLLVGPRIRTFHSAPLDRLLAAPNVQWVGQRPFAELPAYLGASDVGLVPYADTAFNRASFPLKTLDYLAAGLPVVATDLPSVRWLDTDHVRIRTEPDQFADAVEELAKARRGAAEGAERRAFAARHSWQVRAEALASFLGLSKA